MFARSFTLAAAALAFVNAQCSRNATVAAGNTCDDISRTYAVPTYQLALVNNGTVNSACTNLWVGQELCLGWNSMDCKDTYTVVSGDTCNGISSTYNLSSNQLYTNNPQIDVQTCNNIYVGEVLCVSQNSFSYPLVQLPSSSPNNGPASSSPISGDDASPTTWASSSLATSTSTTSAPTASTTGSADDVEYCTDDDQSADCVWEDELPYCDEQ